MDRKLAAKQVKLLEDLLITQLAMARVPQARIRDIVGCDINRVSTIARHISRTYRGGSRRIKNGKKNEERA